MCLSTPAKRKLFLLYCVSTIEFSPLKAKGRKMHLLNRETVGDRLRQTPVDHVTSVPSISTEAPSMDHLDAPGAQSICILREAFAGLKKLALLWSLGKNSNVMIVGARKALLG